MDQLTFSGAWRSVVRSNGNSTIAWSSSIVKTLHTHTHTHTNTDFNVAIEFEAPISLPDL